MFIKTEKGLIDKAYFKIVRETEDFIEVISKNTKHCWIIQKQLSQDKRKMHLYSKDLTVPNHKHSDKVEYYHQHNRTFTVGQAIDDIKGHDDYVFGHVD